MMVKEASQIFNQSSGVSLKNSNASSGEAEMMAYDVMRRGVMILVRYRVDLLGACYFATVFAVASAVVWELSVFRSAGDQLNQSVAVELEEMFALLVMFGGGLLVLLSNFVRQRREMKQRLAAESEVLRLAEEDSLTGLPNRRRLDAELDALLAASRKSTGSHALLLMDLNGFKRVNDVYGHPAGDALLVEVAKRLRAAVREQDLVARLGGDEFAILARRLNGPAEASMIARRIVDALTADIRVGSIAVPIGSAIGIVHMPKDAWARSEALRKADIALYRGKGEGRFAVRTFEAAMDAELLQRDRLESDLSEAIAKDDIKVFYQPKVDLRSGEVVGFEALARWTHASRGVVAPAEFVSLADACGLIGGLTDKLLRKACSDALAWPSQVTLSFNISGAQLRDLRLAERIAAILSDTGLVPGRLIIEIAEPALAQNMSAATKLLEALRVLGVRVALDDFGTGYSSLPHLRELRLDEIKVDRSFVDAMHSNSGGTDVIRALIGLGGALGHTVTAEGVESDEQEKLLLKYGCKLAQGYLFGRAVPANEAVSIASQVELADRLGGVHDALCLAD
jgi:diguanylate cyclase (GGDEF)-like protein